MIKVENLSVSYGRNMPYVIENMNFESKRGEVLNILGQNAVGKTTLIKTLVRELQDYKGSVQIKGKEVGGYSVKEYSTIVGIVSTVFHTYQNLLVADYLVTGFINKMTFFDKPSSEYIEKAYSILQMFGKEELFNKQIDQLSSGEKQIVMIARVLLQNPEVIIVDEPTANLDVRNQIAVLNQIKMLSQKGYTIIVTTHNPGHAFCMGGKTLLMGKKKYLFGLTDEILTSNNLSEYYELEATIKEIEDFKCILFENSKEGQDIKLIF